MRNTRERLENNLGRGGSRFNDEQGSNPNRIRGFNRSHTHGGVSRTSNDGPGGISSN